MDQVSCKIIKIAILVCGEELGTRSLGRALCLHCLYYKLWSMAVSSNQQNQTYGQIQASLEGSYFTVTLGISRRSWIQGWLYRFLDWSSLSVTTMIRKGKGINKRMHSWVNNWFKTIPVLLETAYRKAEGKNSEKSLYLYHFQEMMRVKWRGIFEQMPVWQ